MVAIESDALSRTFRSRWGLKGSPSAASEAGVRDVSLHVPHNSVFAFVGPNGAGKTTMMRLILGLLRPDSGSVRIYGHDIARDRSEALKKVGALIESPALYRHLSGHANLEITRTMLGLPRSETDRVLEIVKLERAARQRVSAYSLGMKQRLALARALLGSPRLLLLDEPTNGLDPDGIIELRGVIRSLPKQIDGTVFVSSHLLAEVEVMADHLGLMRGGRLVMQGRMSEVIDTTVSIAVDTDCPRRAALALRQSGYDVRLIEGKVAVSCESGKCERDVAAAVNRCLVAADIPVCALYRYRPTLEDAYLSASLVREPAELAA